MDNRKLKNVSFSLTDPFELELYHYVLTKGKFSRYVKRLIDKDRTGIQSFVINEELNKKGKAGTFL